MIWILLCLVMIESSSQDDIIVQKCCQLNEILVNSDCHIYNGTEKFTWTPSFLDGLGPSDESFKVIFGVPQCGNLQEWAIYHDKIHDKLALLADGTLRHFAINHPSQVNDDYDDLPRFYDYKVGLYCVDKKRDPKDHALDYSFAMVCAPYVKTSWSESDIILRKIVNPMLHILAIVCYVTVAVVHFILPQLRDLVGNIITSIAVCMVIGQSADLVRIFTEYSSYIGYFIADITVFISHLATYFWLSSLGFYIWKTFRSRNVFLRITDGRKYCYYSFFVWSITMGMTLLALFSHFMLDTPEKPDGSSHAAQGFAIGLLGMAVFFSPIAFSLLMDIYFYITTMQILNRMTMYGRIHHKLKYCFETYIKIFLIMSIYWIFFLLSWLPFNGVFYFSILVNGITAPLILYVSVLNQKKVRFLLKKTCCYERCICPCFRPDPSHDIPEWGEEMMSMNL